MAYNLIVGWIDGDVPADRMLETSRNAYASEPEMILDLQRRPSLVMPEMGSDPDQLARVGSVTELQKVGNVWRYRFAENPAVRAMPLTLIESLAGKLDIDRWDFNRSRWSLKQPDLYRALYEASQSRRPALVARPETGRIAMMMPFTPAFDRVWETVKGLANERGWVCDRADTIWEHDRIMDDVLELIARAQVIVCDLSGHNPNVMYEVGLAHGLSQQIVPIAQSGADALPFDLSAHRTTFYLNNDEGMAKLREDIGPRLDWLMAKPVRALS